MRVVLALFQPHLYSRTRHLAVELADALSAADAVCLADIYAAREQPVEGVTGKLVVDALAQRRPGMWIGWAPGVDDAGRMVSRAARAGDVVVTIGAGDVDRAAPRHPLGAGEDERLARALDSFSPPGRYRALTPALSVAAKLSRVGDGRAPRA